MSLFCKKKFPASIKADGDDRSATNISGLFSPCLITNTCEPDDVFVFKPFTSPNASERLSGTSVILSLDGSVTSPNKYIF